jgi:hypothetical protein
MLRPDFSICSHSKREKNNITPTTKKKKKETNTMAKSIMLVRDYVYKTTDN